MRSFVRHERQTGVEFAPRLPDAIVDRPHLIDRLQNAAAPLVIVRGPSGSGKSTLVAAWMRSEPRPGVWVTRDSWATHRLAFWERVVGLIVDSDAAPADSAVRGIVIGPESTAGLRTALLR